LLHRRGADGAGVELHGEIRRAARALDAEARAGDRVRVLFDTGGDAVSGVAALNIVNFLRLASEHAFDQDVGELTAQARGELRVLRFDLRIAHGWGRLAESVRRIAAASAPAVSHGTAVIAP